MSVDTKVFLTAPELAERHHKTVGTLANERSAGTSPVPFIRVGRRVLYPLAAVVAFENEQLATWAH